MTSSLLLFAVLALLAAVILLYFEYRWTLKSLSEIEQYVSVTHSNYIPIHQHCLTLRREILSLSAEFNEFRHEVKP